MQISKLYFLVSLLVLMALAGCAQAFPTVQVPELPTSLPTEIEQVVEVPEQPAASTAPADSMPNATVSPTDIPTVQPTEEPIPTEVPTESAPAVVSMELHATDPSTVSLASGKVQLVEFFAFW